MRPSGANRYEYLFTIEQLKVKSKKVLKRVLEDMRSRGRIEKESKFERLCLTALYVFSKDDEEAQIMIVCGVIPCLMATFRRYRKEKDVILQIFKIIYNLGGNLRCLEQSGFLSDLLRAASVFKADPEMQAQIFKTFAKACKVTSNVDCLFAQGVAGYLKSALKKHGEVPNVVMSCCQFLCIACRHRDGRLAVINSGIMDELIVCIRSHTESNVILALCKSFKELQQTYSFVRLDGQKDVLRFLSSNKSDVNVAHICFAILADIARLRTNADVLLNKKVIRLIIDTTMLHFQNVKIQEYANKLFWSLSMWEDGKAQLYKANVIVAILAAMKEHRVSASVNYHGCGALSNIVTQESAASLLKQKAERAVIEALKEHHKRDDVNLNGFVALRNLLFYNVKKLDVDCVKDARILSKRAKDRYKNNVTITKHIREVLQYLESNEAGDTPVEHPLEL